MTLKTGEILSHVAEVLMSKANGELSPMRQSFESAVTRASLSDAQIQTVLEYASASAQNLNKTGPSLMWHLFKDGIAKCASSVPGHAPVSKTAVQDFIIFSNWTTQNYRMMMNLDDDQTAPKIFSRASSVSEFEVFLAYLEKTIIPELKKAYRAEHKITPKALETEISLREQELLEKNIPGSEIIKPIPKPKWAEIKSPDATL